MGLASICFDQVLSMTDSALSAASSIAQLKQPNDRVLKVLRRIVDTTGVEEDLIGDYLPDPKKHGPKKQDPKKQDLVALKVSSENDSMTNFLRDNFPTIWSMKVCSTCRSEINVRNN